MHLRLTLSLALTILVIATTGCATMRGGDEERDEVKVTLDQVPPAVRDTILRESNGAKIDTVDQERDHGKTVYETDVMMDGKNWEIKVAEDGKLISKKVDEESKER